MKSYKILYLLLTGIIVSSLTGCYTQVATTDPEPYSTTTIYKQTTESDNYYSEDGELLDSSYYSEIDPDYEESVTIINEYYNNYPSGYYDYYPYISIVTGIGLSWYWGWTSLYSYSYWPYYYPYYSGYWGYGWCYPSYCYYPSYYYYNPYYCNSYYGGYYPYYGYDYGYGYGYPRDEYVSRIRNNSGGRNYGNFNRDPRVAQTNGSINRVRDDLNLGRDLTVDRNSLTDRSLEIQNRTGDLTREVVGLKDVERIKNTKRNDVSSNEISRTTDIRKDKQLGLDREVTTKKNLGNFTRNDVSKNTRNNSVGKYSNQINKNNRIGSETKKLFDGNRSGTKTNVGTKTNTNKSNVKNNTKRYQQPKNNTNTRTYTPPKQNNNKPRTYSQPKGNNNTSRSYTPPRSNNTPRSNTPPSRNSGSNNSGGRKR